MSWGGNGTFANLKRLQLFANNLSGSLPRSCVTASLLTADLHMHSVRQSSLHSRAIQAPGICLMLRVHVAFIHIIRNNTHAASHSEVAVWTINTLTHKSSRRHVFLHSILPELWTGDRVAY